jgi:hypothetical protein
MLLFPRLSDVFDGVPVISDRHVGEANLAMGNNGGEAQKIGSLTPGARGLLVAMVCCSVPGVFTGGRGGDMSDIRKSFDALVDLKKKSGGIMIGFESSDANVQNWTKELANCSLIVGGENSCGGNRSFAKSRSIKVINLPSYHCILWSPKLKL